jgi:hypothetical protein
MPRPLVRPTVIPRLGITQPGAIPAQNPAAIGATPPAIATAQAPQNTTQQVKTPQGLVSVSYALRGNKYQPTSIVSNLVFKQPIQKNGIDYGIGTFTYELQGNQIMQKLESFTGNTITAPINSSGNVTSNGAAATYKFTLQGNSIEPVLIGASGSLTQKLTASYIQGAGNNVGLGTLTYPLTVTKGQLTYGTPSYSSTTIDVTVGEYVYNYFTGNFQKIGITTPYTTSYNAATGQVNLNNAGINAYVGGYLSLQNYVGTVNVGGKAEQIAGNEMFEVNLATGSASYQPINLGFVGANGSLSQTISLNSGLTKTTYGLMGAGIPIALSSIGGTQDVSIGGAKVPISFSGPLGIYGFGSSLSPTYNFTTTAGTNYSLAINPQSGQISGTMTSPGIAVPQSSSAAPQGSISMGLATPLGSPKDETIGASGIGVVYGKMPSSQKPTAALGSVGIISTGSTTGFSTSSHLFGIKFLPVVTFSYTFAETNNPSKPINSSASAVGIQTQSTAKIFGQGTVNAASNFQTSYQNNVLNPISQAVASISQGTSSSKSPIISSAATAEYIGGTVYGFASFPSIVASVISGNLQIPSVSGFMHEAITQPGFTAGALTGPAIVTFGLGELMPTPQLESATAVSLVKNVGTATDRLTIDTEGATLDMGEATTPAEVYGLVKSAYDLAGSKAEVKAAILLKFSDDTKVLAVLKADATTYNLGLGAGNSAIGLTKTGIGIADYYKIVPTEDVGGVGSAAGTALAKVNGGDLTGFDKEFTLQPIKNLQGVGISSVISKTSTDLSAVKASEAPGFKGIPLPGQSEGFVSEGATESQLFSKDIVYDIKPGISAVKGEDELPANPSDLIAKEQDTVKLGLESSKPFRAFTEVKQMPLTQESASFFGEKAGTPVSVTYGESTLGNGVPLRYFNFGMDAGKTTEYGAEGGGDYGGAEYSSGKGSPLQLTGDKGGMLQLKAGESPLQLISKQTEGISPAAVTKVADVYASTQSAPEPTLAFASIYSGSGAVMEEQVVSTITARPTQFSRQIQIGGTKGLTVGNAGLSGIQITKLLQTTSGINTVKLDPLISDLFNAKKITIVGGMMLTTQSSSQKQNRQPQTIPLLGQGSINKTIVGQNQFQSQKQVLQQQQPQPQRTVNTTPNATPPPGLDIFSTDIGDLGRIPQPRIRPQNKLKTKAESKRPQKFIYVSDLTHSILNIRAKGKRVGAFRKLGINRPLL